jgi:hypothetical protein
MVALLYEINYWFALKYKEVTDERGCGLQREKKMFPVFSAFAMIINNSQA